MFNNTSVTKTNPETNNIVLDLDLGGRPARVEMSHDEWIIIQNAISKQTSSSVATQLISLPMIFNGREARLNLSKKEHRLLQESILLLQNDDPKKSKANISMEMTLQGRMARVDMTKSEFTRWLCLLESIELIDQKCSEMNMNMTDDFWIQPIALQKYMDTRFETMLDEVNRHEFGIDTKMANMDILKRKTEICENEEIEEDVDVRYSLCTS